MDCCVLRKKEKSMTPSPSMTECRDRLSLTERLIKMKEDFVVFGNTKGLIYVDPKQVDEVRIRKVRPLSLRIFWLMEFLSINRL